MKHTCNILNFTPTTIHVIWYVYIRYIHNRHFTSLTNFCTFCRTLKKLCRAAIFQRLGLYAPKKIEKLPISQPLKDYLCFPEHIKEEFYLEKTLSNEDCPYDCAVLCSSRQCPPLDLSFSDDSDQDIEYW